VIEHVPAVIKVTVAPETVQTEVVVEANVTASPELALALSGGGVELSDCVPGGTNVIVCATCVMVKL